MKTKLGQTVPEELASALGKQPKMLEMWDKLRPSCQRSYSNHVAEAKKPETRQRRVGRVLEMTADYYRRHPDGSTGKA